MGRRGRPALGARHVDRLDGTDASKKRLEVILRALHGELTVEQACAELGVGPAQFHRLREQALSGALAELEPKPRGRPARAPDAPGRVEELEAQVLDLQMELRAAQLREEIALVMPHLLKPEPAADPPPKKVRRRRRRKRKGR